MNKTPSDEKERRSLGEAVTYRGAVTYLKKVKFTTKLFGVDEADVWRKIEKLCELYETAIELQRDRIEELEQQLQGMENPPETQRRGKKAIADHQMQEIEPHG